MIKVIARGRNTGKTIELIKHSAETGAYIVCQSEQQASHLQRQARELGFDIPFPLTYREFLSNRYLAGGIKSFAIDNAEMLLQEISRVPITAVTINDESDTSGLTEMQKIILGIQ